MVDSNTNLSANVNMKLDNFKKQLLKATKLFALDKKQH